jgi:hypothetical protein
MDTFRPSATIDWLSYTIHWNQAALQRFISGGSHDKLSTQLTNHVGPWIVERPAEFYPYVYSHAGNAGLRVSISEVGSPQGVHISFSGSSLAQVNPRAVLRNALAMGANVTRIDIAIDTPRWLDLEGYKDALDRGEAETRARDWNLITGRTGQTLYVGSRTSEKFLRIYNKAAEQRVEGSWYRIELECKGDVARGVALHVDGNGYDYFGDIIRGFCHWPNIYCWENVTASPTLLEGIPRPEKRRDTFAWLMKSVVPSVAKLLIDDHEKFVQFLRSVYTHAGVGDGVGESDPFDGQADWEPRPRH